MKVSKDFWVNANSIACHLINRMPSSVLCGQIPYSILFLSQPLFPFPLKVYGCTCFVQDVRHHIYKLDLRSLKCIFSGYTQYQKGYCCFSSDLGKYLVSIDLSSFETTSC